MKTIYLLLFIACTSYAQIINFPDANFKAKLLQSSPSNKIARTGWFGTYAGLQWGNFSIQQATTSS
jgi:hypothetical protein